MLIGMVVEVMVKGSLVAAAAVGAAVSKPVVMLVEASVKEEGEEEGKMGRREWWGCCCWSGRRWSRAPNGLGVARLGLTHPRTPSHSANASTAASRGTATNRLSLLLLFWTVVIIPFQRLAKGWLLFFFKNTASQGLYRPHPKAPRPILALGPSGCVVCVWWRGGAVSSGQVNASLARSLEGRGRGGARCSWLLLLQGSISPSRILYFHFHDDKLQRPWIGQIMTSCPHLYPSFGPGRGRATCRSVKAKVNSRGGGAATHASSSEPGVSIHMGRCVLGPCFGHWRGMERLGMCAIVP